MADSSSYSASASAPHRPCWNYDVFLSFRGEDTRKNFTDHLYTALINAGIRTFRDDEELPRGEEIRPELLKAIEESRMAIIVFSKNYAESSWCLDELVKILETRAAFGQRVIPVFYNVDPSEVRKQSGCFGEHFKRHEERFKAKIEKVRRWRDELTKAADISGHDLHDGHESQFIGKIVNEVSHVVNPKYLNVAKHPVGMDSRVEDIYSSLSIGSGGVRIIGIYGTGGIGKTTLANAVYNRIYLHFDGTCYLENVRECSLKHDGLIHLQQKLLSQILNQDSLTNVIHSIARGISLIKERLGSKNVLIILDDVDHSSQLDALAGGHNWFGPGSRIIITTRDLHLLDGCGADVRYKAKQLEDDESLELFSWHAFKNSRPTKDKKDLSNYMVGYAQRLPLALVVLGSYLCGKTMQEWRSAFDKIKQIPPDDIQKKLKISYDALDDTTKCIFLDIACFFMWEQEDNVISILNACDLFAETGIRDLKDRCLLENDEDDRLKMHDLIRDMGREIVRKESLRELRRRSRLWLHRDVLDVLEIDEHGTKNIEGIVPNSPIFEHKQLTTEAFAGMHKLRLLDISKLHLIGSFEHIFKRLRWLRWIECPLKSLPSNFKPERLVILEMQYSSIESLWPKSDNQGLINLKVLNLSWCQNLKRSPDFTGTPNLEILLFPFCTSLLELHPSIGFLERLVRLDLERCERLSFLPDSICRLNSLEYIGLSNCPHLYRLPEQFGNLNSLKQLVVYKRPDLWWLSPLSEQHPVSLLPRQLSPGLISVQHLTLSGCILNDNDAGIADDIGSLSELISLDLSCNYFSTLPSSLCQLTKLESLDLSSCPFLRSLPELPPNLLVLNLEYCRSLESLPHFGHLPKIEKIILRGCENLQNIPELPPSLVNHLDFNGCRSLEILPCLVQLSKVQEISVLKCEKLLSIPELPPNVVVLNAYGCKKLEILPSLVHLSKLKTIIFHHCENLRSIPQLPQVLIDLGVSNCHRLAEIQGLENIDLVRNLYMENCFHVEIPLLKKSFFQVQSHQDNFVRHVVHPVKVIPDWFHHQTTTTASSLSFHVPSSHVKDDFRGIILWAVFVTIGDRFLNRPPLSVISGQNRVFSWSDKYLWNVNQITEEHSHVSYIPRDIFPTIEAGDKFEVSFKGIEETIVNKFGIHMIYKSDFETKNKNVQKNKEKKMEWETNTDLDNSCHKRLRLES